ncbi:MAG: C39 family peptidase [Lachnospiraceae bacterium]
MKKRKSFLKKLLLTVWIALMLAEAARLLGIAELSAFSLGAGVWAEDASETEALLLKLAENSPDIAIIYENKEAYPQALLTALANNPEMVEFVKGYLTTEHIVTGGFSEEELTAEFPLLLQWDKRWGYVDYGSNNIGVAGCGPTCLSMVILALTGNENATPDELAEYSEENGHYVKGAGTAWSLMTEGAEAYGLRAEEISLDEKSMQDCLDNGNPIICVVRKGDFTTSGHFIVIYGYDENGFLVNDPNSISRSERQWEFETLKGQIKNLWAYECE